MYKENNIGLRIEPWGILEVIVEEKLPVLILTETVLLKVGGKLLFN